MDPVIRHACGGKGSGTTCTEGVARDVQREVAAKTTNEPEMTRRRTVSANPKVRVPRKEGVAARKVLKEEGVRAEVVIVIEEEKLGASKKLIGFMTGQKEGGRSAKRASDIVTQGLELVFKLSRPLV